MTSQPIDFGRLLARTREGGIASGKLVPLNNVGPLRVTYNWLYSALNCNPNDGSDFSWTLSKVGSGSTVSLSPTKLYSGANNGRRVYASVRPDLDYRVEVQAPGSGTWIGEVRGDEEMTLVESDLFIISLIGLNGKRLSVSDTWTTHVDSSGQNHSGHLVHADSSTAGPSSKFLFAVQTVLQPEAELPVLRDLDVRDVAAALARQGARDADAMARAAMS